MTHKCSNVGTSAVAVSTRHVLGEHKSSKITRFAIVGSFSKKKILEPDLVWLITKICTNLISLPREICNYIVVNCNVDTVSDVDGPLVLQMQHHQLAISTESSIHHSCLLGD